jgi:ketosteroid isomerase-like protein
VEILERYFAALRAHDWTALGACLADDVQRAGPYQDEVRGREAYVAFLSGVLPSLENHALEVSRIRRLEDGSAVVELAETADVDGVSTRFPEALLFDFDRDGLICRVDIYLKQPPRSRAARPSGRA